jgi:hypothetical protein
MTWDYEDDVAECSIIRQWSELIKHVRETDSDI